MDTLENVAALVDEYRTLLDEADSNSSDSLETTFMRDGTRT